MSVISRKGESLRRLVSTSKMGKYVVLESPPVPDDAFVDGLGGGTRPNDAVDNALLFAVARNAVELLVTGDGGILKKAMRAGLAERVYSPDQLYALLRLLEAEPPKRHGPVTRLPVHDLDLDDPFFDSIREDYPGFDGWLQRVGRGGRNCYALREGGNLEALMIYKEVEAASDYAGVPPNSFKISTLKVSSTAEGKKLGELFLKIAVWAAFQQRRAGVFVTVFPRHEGLVHILGEFGFGHVSQTELGEDVYLKRFYGQHVGLGPETLDDRGLGFTRRFYPSFRDGADVAKFVVPIQPSYHARLFPEGMGEQSTLRTFTSEVAIEGNTIRKAYLSNAKIKELGPGSVLLFYRSHDRRAVESIGVVEGSYRPATADEAAALAGKRTVYSFREISVLSEKPLLLVLFWHVAELPNGVTFETMKRHGVVTGPIQTIARLPEPRYRRFKEVAHLDERLAISQT